MKIKVNSKGKRKERERDIERRMESGTEKKR
jgi:hypothetical protein